MAEMDPIVKTVCLVLTAAAIFIIVLIVFAKNNPVFAQTLLNSIGNVTDAETGYNPIPTHT
jgi:hypothetical protein